MIPLLGPVEVRVLGCLIEKENTTPEYYPLTLNALVNACNQKSNRDPVVSYDEDTVQEALDYLREKRLITVLTGGGNRVPKYGHRISDHLNLGRREIALLCELMLRGSQTLGELRDRAGRMHRFSDIEEVEACVNAMAEAEQRLTAKLPRQAGMKEPRYAHLLSGPDAVPQPVAEPVRSAGSTDRSSSLQHDLRSSLEAELAELKERVAALEEDLRRFKEQFGA
jgi:uncharacterized protein YceH (UPF0502 family)